MEIADSLYNQVVELGGEIELENVVRIENKNPFEIVGEYETYKAKSVIIATGTTYRMMGLPKEEEFIGNGISFCVTCDGAFYKDKVVAVIGGGNSALIETIELSKICKQVYMIVRENKLSGEKANIDQIDKLKNVTIMYNTSVKELLGEEELTGLKLNNDETLNVDGIFEAIGQIPNINIVDNINKDSKGFVESNEDCTTNIPGIFVSGDVKSKKVRQLTTATSDGTIAALNAIKYLDNN
jgi:thioredoxin reductase (NADPH)